MNQNSLSSQFHVAILKNQYKNVSLKLYKLFLNLREVYAVTSGSTRSDYMAIRVMAPGQDIHWLKCSTGCGCEAVHTVAPSQYVSGQYEQWLRVKYS